MRTALSIALVSCFIAAAPARASDVETGAIMICNTQQQVQRLGQLFEDKAPAAIAKVNAEQKDPDACGVADVAYVTGKVLGTVRSKSRTFHVVPVIVFGVNTPAGYQAANSTVFFTLVQVKEWSI
jgi:hypothetical protein